MRYANHYLIKPRTLQGKKQQWLARVYRVAFVVGVRIRAGLGGVEFGFVGRLQPALSCDVNLYRSKTKRRGMGFGQY